MSDQGGGMRAAARQVVGRALARFMDVTRRVRRWLPAPMRARLRDLVAWSDRHRAPALIEDWSTPLITGHSGQAAPGSVLAGATGTGTGVVQPTRPQNQVAADPADGAPTLRCLLVTSLLDVGGMDEMVAFLARCLPGQRVRTAVLHATSSPSATGEPTGRLGRMLRANGIDVHEADESGAPGWVERWRPDVISAHGAPDWMLAVAQRVGVPYVDNLHGMHTHFWADWRAEAARAAKFSAIVSVSEAVRQQYLAGNRRFPARPNRHDPQRGRR